MENEDQQEVAYFDKYVMTNLFANENNAGNG